MSLNRMFRTRQIEIYNEHNIIIGCIFTGFPTTVPCLCIKKNNAMPQFLNKHQWDQYNLPIYKYICLYNLSINRYRYQTLMS